MMAALVGFDAAPPSVELTDADDEEPPLIGQVEAAEVLRMGIERAFTLGATTTVTLEGERGAGKTRLLIYASEFAARAAEDVRVIYGMCREGDGSYAPFSRLLLERFDVKPSSSPSHVRAQMATKVAAALQTSEAITVAETTHLLGHVAGIPFPASPFLTPLKENPDELHRRATRAIRRLIEGESQIRPVCVLLDNMHLADDQAWDAVRAICEAEGHVAVVIAGDVPVAERASELPASGGNATGAIDPLREEDVATMLHVLLPGLTETPEPLVAAIAHRSRGNPAAVRELVYALWEEALFVQRDDEIHVDMAKFEAGEIPITMGDAIRARVDRLDALDRETLDRAAVVGEVFWEGALLGQMRSDRGSPSGSQDALLIWTDDQDLVALRRSLESLIDRGFVEQAEGDDLPSGGAHFRFSVAGLREMIYEEMNPDIAVQRHAAVARWLALIGQARRDTVAARIAPHLELAGQTVRAGRAYLEAATYDRAALKTTSALRHIQKAIEHIPGDDVVRRIDALHEHGSLLTMIGQYDGAFDTFREMLMLAWKVGARGKGGAAFNRMARTYRMRGQDLTARAYLGRALELFRDSGDTRGVAATLDDLATIDALQGDADGAVMNANEALEIRRGLGDRRGEALSLHTLGAIERQRGNPTGAERAFRAALEIRQQIHDLEGILQSHIALGVMAYERTDPETAIQAWQLGLEQARAIADRRAECVLLNNIGEALVGVSELADAEVSLQAARDLANELDDRRTAADIERNLGLLALKRGSAEAKETLLRAFELAEKYGGVEAIGLAHRALGQLRAQTLFDADGDQAGDASASFLKSIEVFRENGNEPEAARSLIALGTYLLERGDRDGAKTRFREARTSLRKVGLLTEAEALHKKLTELG